MTAKKSIRSKRSASVPKAKATKNMSKRSARKAPRVQQGPVKPGGGAQWWDPINPDVIRIT
jgi:hypothetical protein